MDYLSTLKNLLGLADNDQDEKLQWIIDSTEARLKLLLGIAGDEDAEVPEALTYIVIDVSCARFNRIASEGMRTDSVEGESIAFYDHDFDPYLKEINAWLAEQDDDVTGGKGKVRFI